MSTADNDMINERLAERMTGAEAVTAHRAEQINHLLRTQEWAEQVRQAAPTQYTQTVPYFADRVPELAAPAPTTGGYNYIGGTQPLGRPSNCSPFSHYFTCKHEVTCECGEVIRQSAAAQAVSDGL